MIPVGESRLIPQTQELLQETGRKCQLHHLYELFFSVTDVLSLQFIPVRYEEYSGSNDVKLHVIR